MELLISKNVRSTRGGRDVGRKSCTVTGFFEGKRKKGERKKKSFMATRTDRGLPNSEGRVKYRGMTVYRGDAYGTAQLAAVGGRQGETLFELVWRIGRRTRATEYYVVIMQIR